MWLLTILLTVLFVGLKLAGILAWGWLWVLSPIPLLLLFLLIIYFLGHFLIWFGSR